jgi:hypothetical protein
MLADTAVHRFAAVRSGVGRVQGLSATAAGATIGASKEASAMVLPTPFRRLLAAGPDLALAGLFAAVWLQPARFEPAMPRHLSMLMMFEVVLMHAGIVLLSLADFGHGLRMLRRGDVEGGTRPLFLEHAMPGPHASDAEGRAKNLYLVVGCAMIAYLVFALVFAAAFESAWPLFALLATFLAKAGGLLAQAAPARIERDRVLIVSMGCVAAYMLGFFATASIPDIPALGLEGRLPLDPALPGFSVWQQAPQRLCAYGLAYFTVCAAIRALVVQRAPESALVQ